MWLFGYGSLIWKVDFPIQRRVVGYIKGCARRFYQSSPEHRGEPDKPGRVVTLVPSSDSEEIVWGVAYEISEENVTEVLDHLDYREKSGYEKRNTVFYPRDSSWSSESPFNLTVYIADPHNRWYTAETDLKEIARHIAVCRGKSGPNSEYLFKLADSLRSISPDAVDRHVLELEAEVKRILQNNHRSC